MDIAKQPYRRPLAIKDIDIHSEKIAENSLRAAIKFLEGSSFADTRCKGLIAAAPTTTPTTINKAAAVATMPFASTSTFAPRG